VLKPLQAFRDARRTNGSGDRRRIAPALTDADSGEPGESFAAMR